MRKVVMRLAWTISLLYIIAMGYLYTMQDALVFNAQAIEKQDKVSGVNIETISLHVSDEAILDGIYKKSENAGAPLIIYFGGNADDATRFVLHVEHIRGYDIVALNYRGYLGSSGKPSEKALFEDALKIYDTYAKDKSVILIGRSLGTGVASYVASQRDVKGVVLITPYDSIVSVAKHQYPFFPIEVLLKHKFETLNYIPSIKAPIAIIEVKNDTTIPRYHLEKLLEKLPATTLHVTLNNTTHGKVLEASDFEKELINILGKLSE
ncbi:MAG: alpha/beta fold hydrolase [Sulfurospirillaceae bacterium]|nr:alpha/beta fold hydrolase [Sulfurospirillaceae bacterium]MDD2826858.1 alpha/beta fold hydrolase [Sulfurospirillaceae bacterium]